MLRDGTKPPHRRAMKSISSLPPLRVARTQTESMQPVDTLRYTKLLLNTGSAIPALGFGTLIPKAEDTKRALSAAVVAGFRQFDCAERYGNEAVIGEELRRIFSEGTVRREEMFLAT